MYEWLPGDNANGTIGDLVDRDRQSRAFGLFYTLTSVCSIVAPLAYGVLGDWLGIEVALAIAACLVLLTLPFALVLRSAASLHTSRAV